MIKSAEEQVKKYFESNRWNTYENTEGTFFYKNRNPTQIKGYEFLGYSKKKGLVSASDMIGQLKEFFIPLGYEKKKSKNIIRPNKSSTFFMTSGIQSFEEDLIEGKIPEVTDSLFIQPVIRTNYATSVGEGNVSSFVNPSTIRFDCSPEQYVEDLDNWMNFLSKTGLYLADFNFKLKSKENSDNSQNPWKRNKGFVVSCSYGGLGLGDAGYCSIPNGQKPFEDIGFGLERLLWARNKTSSFKDIVGVFPYSFNQSMKTIDTFRTLSLMAMSNINTNEDANNQFKKYLSQIDLSSTDIEPQIRTYYKFWNQFVAPQKGMEETIQYLTGKVNEIRNTNTLKKIGMKNVPKGLNRIISQDQDPFIREVIKLNLNNLSLLRKLCEDN